jgi:regulator of sigma E protease
MLLSIIVFIISLSLVIILHELGHFVMARRAGILCHEFSLGMGPVIWKTKKGETTYSVRAIPIGGYVMMAGEEINDELVKPGMEVGLIFKDGKVDRIITDHNNVLYQNYEKFIVEKIDLKGKDNTDLYINDFPVHRDAFYVLRKQELQIAPYDRGFEGKTIKQRFAAIFAGPMMNFILAFFVFIIVNLLVGFPQMETSVIGNVAENMPAENILQVGDKVEEVNGVDVTNWEEMSNELNNNISDRSINLTINRNGTIINETLTPILYYYSIGFHSSEDAVDLLEIGQVTADTKADSAGFKEGDILVSVFDSSKNDFVDLNSWADVNNEISRIGNLPYQEGFTVDFIVNRDGENITLTVEEPFSEAFLESQGIDLITMRIGIGPDYSFSFIDSIVYGAKDVWFSAGIIFTTIGLLFDNSGAGAGIGVDNLAGPLGIFQITSSALEQGFISLLSWIGLLSVNLGVINLLPIPALDGGRLVFLGYEGITKRKPNKKIENTLHYVMYLALMGLFVFITYNDLLRLLGLK